MTPILILTMLMGGDTYGIIAHDCAPWDGAAISFYVADHPMTGAHPEPPWRSIRLYQGLAGVLGHSFEVGPLTTRVGIAQECKRNGECRTAESASVRLGRTTGGKTVDVTYRFDFGKGDIVAGSVRAELRLERTMCG